MPHCFRPWMVAIARTRASPPPSWGHPTQPLSKTQLSTCTRDAQAFQATLDKRTDRETSAWADAAIFTKGLSWALRYDSEFTQSDVRLLGKATRRAAERLTGLSQGSPKWITRRGKLALGYVSNVDGSVQPYGVIVPKN